MSFWQSMNKPFYAVAPMADVTDAAFRRLIAKYSNWQERDDCIMWTEFVAADGLVRATPEGKEKLMADLIYTDEERPIVAQLFSSNTEHMEYAANLCRELGFDAIDINMGCPDRSIEKQGCGSAMIKTPDVAVSIIEAAKRGAKTGESGGIPVSVKTRLGYNEDEVETWIPTLLKANPVALTVHARTRKEMSKVPARWERIARVVELRDSINQDIKVLGNGDVLSMIDAKQKLEETGADGAMIGRALFGNPWFFNPNKQLPLRLTALPTHGVDRDTIVEEYKEGEVEYVTLEERLGVLVEHTKLFTELLPLKNFATMKKHFKAYVSGFAGAAELRAELMSTNSPEEVETIVHQFLGRG